MGTLGNTPQDPQAQAYVRTAQYAYTNHLIPQSYLNTVLIFVPSDPGIQRFVTAVRNDAMVSSAVPEPVTGALMASGLLFFAWRRKRA